MEITESLKDSLNLLRTKPEIFIPKFVTTTLYTGCILVLMRITLKMNEIATGFVFAEKTGIIQLLVYTLLLLISLVFIYLIDLLTYAMYPSIVSDYYNNKPVSLRKALREALGSWPVLMVFGLLISLMVMFVIIPFAMFMTLTRESPYIQISLFLLVLTIILVFAVLVFFVIPVAVIEKKEFTQTFRESFSLSLKHRWDILRINLVFLFLTVLTVGIGLLSGLRGFRGYLAVVIFVMVRLIQAVVYTYISVVNPYLFIKIKNHHVIPSH